MAKSNSTARERGPACPMADATLPQTKYAQNLKPYEGEPPSYIRAMDEYASRVGLTIRHLRDRDYIVLVYSGTREQIGAFGLSQEESIRWPSGAKVSSKVSLYKVSPCGYPNHGCIFKINEERYAIQIKEPTPRSISTVGDSIECFDFNDGTNWGYVAYVGEKDKLISEGITGADMFPGDSTEEGSNGKENTSPYECAKLGLPRLSVRVLLDPPPMALRRRTRNAQPRVLKRVSTHLGQIRTQGIGSLASTISSLSATRRSFLRQRIALYARRHCGINFTRCC